MVSGTVCLLSTPLPTLADFFFLFVMSVLARGVVDDGLRDDDDVFFFFLGVVFVEFVFRQALGGDGFMQIALSSVRTLGPWACDD